MPRWWDSPPVDTISGVGRWTILGGWMVGGVCMGACSLGALDGLSGGETAPDAGDDAAASGGDAGGTLDATGKRFCESLAQPARLCIDFDDGTFPEWFTRKEAPGANIVLGANGKDGTGGFAAIAAPDATNGAAGCIYGTLAGPRSGIVLEADVRALAVGTDNFDLLNLRSGSSRELGVSLTNASFLIEEDVPDAGAREVFTVSTATIDETWKRLRLVASVSEISANAELFVDGVSSAKHVGLRSTVTDTTTLEIGDCVNFGAKNWHVVFDNIVVYETP